MVSLKLRPQILKANSAVPYEDRQIINQIIILVGGEGMQ